MNELTTVALKCLIMILTTAITTVLVPYFRSKISEEKWLKLQDYAIYAVRYAEQIYTPEEWAQKKKYVYGYYVDIEANEMYNRYTENIRQGCTAGLPPSRFGCFYIENCIALLYNQINRRADVRYSLTAGKHIY